MWPAPACAWVGRFDQSGSRGVYVSSRAPWTNEVLCHISVNPLIKS